MKKISIYAVLLLLGFAATAQSGSDYSFKSKNGHEVLPQSGDWALGFSANPFLNFAGNAMSGFTGFNNSPVVQNANGATILNNQLGLGQGLFGKYMLDGSTAIRVRFMANYTSETFSNFVAKDELNANVLLPSFVEDTRNIRTSTNMIAAGIEKRRGQGRLQGVYGGEFFLGYSRTRQTTEYGNPMNIDFVNPNSTTNFPGTNAQPQAIREVERDFGPRFFTGVRGFIGVEYFIAPKISLGAEVGYSFGFVRDGDGYILNERFDGGNLEAVKVETKTQRNNGISSAGFGLDNTNANINLLFYF
jgi:hypothetical protein